MTLLHRGLSENNQPFSHHPQDLDLNNSYASTAELVPEETCNQKNAKDGKKEKSKLPEVQLLKEETPKNVEKSEVQKKMEEKHKPFKEVGTPKSQDLFYGINLDRNTMV